ncbi:MAG: glutathione S-transferase [Kordiimonadales bacterium]|nr:MAG: glutathione S-transferase [Kordiimonadales bacterium]
MTAPHPILYSFRRCPYAMRARMAIKVSGQQVALREVVLRDKPEAMIEVSPKATVPVLVLTDGIVVDESFDIMLWALAQNDPEGWLVPEVGTLDEMLALVQTCDRDFKSHLDRYKYENRYEGVSALEHRAEAESFLAILDTRLEAAKYLFGSRPALADFAVAPFIRQFANVDKDWFGGTPYKHLQRWLATFLVSPAFTSVMHKYPQWHSGDALLFFGGVDD